MPHFLVALALAASTLSSPGYTYLQVGVDSNFLIDSNRVLFAQADGSLTALALGSGEVLARNKSLYFSGNLLRTPDGILVLNDRNIALLDPATLNTVWQTRGQQSPFVTDHAVISQSSEGRVECRQLEDGSLSWSYPMPGVLQIAAAGGGVFILRSATYEAGASPVAVCLNEKDGTELFRRAPANHMQWGSAFMNASNLFLVAGSYNLERSDYQPESLVVWNTRGEELQSLPIPTSLRTAVKDGKPFDLDGKTFWMGRVYPGPQALPIGRLGRSHVILEQTNSSSRSFETDYDLGDGATFISHAKYLDETNGEGGAFVMEVEWREPDHQWSGVLPYLLDRGRIVALARADGKILVGTDFGQVECIEADTGESAWLYTFPTMRRTLSYSARGMPPTQTEAAAAFQRDNANPPSSGLHVINGKARAPRIVVDPEPVDPYRGLARRLFLAWTATGVGLAAFLLVHSLGWWRRWNSSSVGGAAVWITFLVFCGYLAYGRVSPESSLALKGVILSGFLFGLWDTIQSFRRHLWIEGCILAITFAGIGLFMYLTTA